MELEFKVFTGIHRGQASYNYRTIQDTLQQWTDNMKHNIIINNHEKYDFSCIQVKFMTFCLDTEMKLLQATGNYQCQKKSH